MKTTLSLSLAMIAAATTSAALAQAPGNATSTGLLGQRYGEISAGAFDPHGSSDLGFAGALAANVPLRAGLDLGLGYGYNRTRTELLSGLFTHRAREHVAGANLTAYTHYQGVKPFAEVGLGYSWAKDKLSFGGSSVSDAKDHTGLWGLGVGVEIPVGAVTLTPRISYRDDFERGAPGAVALPSSGTGTTVLVSRGGSGGAFSYGTEAHVWFTRAVGGFAEIAYSDPTGGGTQSWTYALGARLRF